MSRKNTKVIGLVVVMAFMLVFAFAGCGAQQGAEPTKAGTASETEKAETAKKLKIVFVTPLIGHPVWLDAKRGYEDAAKEFGFDTQWVGPEGVDMDSMVKQIEMAIAQKVDGIISCPLNPEAFAPVYKKAKEAGIPIVNTAVDSPEDTRLAFIGTDTVEAGKIGAEALAQKMNGKANILVMQGSMDAGNQNSIFDSFKATLDAKYPDMKIVVRESDDSDMLKAVDKYNTILQNNKDINAIYCIEASAGPAAAQVLKEKQLVGKVTVLAVDDMADTIGYIKSGELWATYTQNFYKMGYDGAKFIIDSLAKKEVPSITDSGTTIVSKDNVDTYKK